MVTNLCSHYFLLTVFATVHQLDSVSQGRRKQNESGGPNSGTKHLKEIFGPSLFFWASHFYCRWEIKNAIHLSDFLYTTQDVIYGYVTAGNWSSQYSVVALLWKCFIMQKWKWNKSRNQANQWFVTVANSVMKFAAYVAQILLCENCKFGEKI